MPRVFGTLRPLNDTDTYPVVDVDINARGFTRVVADAAARDGIPAFLRSTSMLVFQRDTGQIWAWTGSAWALFAFNGTGFTFDAAAIVSGTMATARLGSGTASSNTFLRGDQTWSAIAVSNLPSMTSTQLAGILTDETGSGSAVFATAPTIVGGTHVGLTGLGIRSTGAAFDVRLASAEAITADRTLSFVLGNTDRTLTVGAGASVAGTNTGDQTITLTGDVTGSGTGSFAATIANNAVTLAKMATMATASLLGRSTGGIGNVEVLSSAAVKTLLLLNNVENTALSTWTGSSNITTLGTIATGTWNATTIGLARGGTNADLSVTGGAGQFLKQTSSGGAVSVAAITAADLATGTANNTTYLRGDLTWASVTSGFTNPMTSVGDLILGGASGAATRLAIGSSGNVLRSNGTTAAWATLGHSELSGLTSGNPHTQYIWNAPISGSTQNVVNPGDANHKNIFVILQGDPNSFPGSGVDEPYFGVWRHGGTVPAWMLTNNDGVFQQVQQSVPLRMYNTAGTFYSEISVGTLSSNVTFRLPTTNGSNGHVLTTNGSGVTSWAAPSGGFANPMTTNGDLITQTAGSPARLAIGSSGTFLRSNGSAASWNALAVSDLPTITSAQLASLLSDETGSGAAVFGTSPTISAPTISGGTHTALTALGIRSTGAAFDLTLASSEALTAGRTLSINVGDAARTLTLSGNATISGTNTGDQTSVSGNAGTATALQNARTINGVSFDGTANITVPAAAGTLTGSSLAAGVTGSSLTSLGTIGTGVWQGTVIGLAYGGTNANLSATGGTGQVLRQSTVGGAVSVATLAHSELTGLTTGDPHTQYLTLTPGSNTRNVITGPAALNEGLRVNAGTDFTVVTGVARLTSWYDDSNNEVAAVAYDSVVGGWGFRLANASSLILARTGAGIPSSILGGQNGANNGGVLRLDAGTAGAGGSINVSGGASAAGGSINTSNGGGSITTNGAAGSIQLGVAATRTTINGAGATATITMPSGTGTLCFNTGSTSIVTLGTVSTGTWNATAIGLSKGGTGVDLSAGGGTGFVLKQAAGGVISSAALVASDIPNLAASKITSGNLAIAQGGTGAGTANAGFAALSPMTTNGDLILQAGGVPTRLAIGTTGQSLRVVSGAPAWATSAGQRTNSQISSDQNDYAIDSSDVTDLVLVSADANGRTITGLAGGSAARVVRLLNNGTTDIIFTHQDSASTAANRLVLPYELAMVLRPGDCWTLIYDSTNSRWRLIAGYDGYVNDPAFVTDQFDDFSHGTNSNGTFGTLGWSLNTNGGTYTHSTNESGRYGVVQIGSGTTSSGRGEVVSNNPTNVYVLGNQVFEAMVRVPTLAAAGATDYSVIIGWSNNMSAAGGSGDQQQIAFVYNRSLSTNWATVTAGASQTRTDSGVAASTGWVRLKCVLNTALNSAKFYINDALVATHSTNFPSSGPYAFKFGIWNSADASHTSMPLQVDAWRMRIFRTTRR